MFLLIVYMLVALGFSFLCSIAEAVLLSTTPSYISLLEQQGRRSGRLLRSLNNDLGRPLAAILSLNTIAHTVGAAGVGAQSSVVFESVNIGIISAVLTFLILIFSEIIPKTLGVTHWRGLAPLVADGVAILIWLMYPLVYLSEKLNRLLSKGEKANSFSRKEFAAMAKLGRKEGKLGATESHIVMNLFRFPSLRVKDILTPRTVMFSLHEEMTVDEVMKTHRKIPFSRIPIYRHGPDDVDGFVLKSDILLAQARDRHDARLHEFKREIGTVPDLAPLSSLFEVLLQKREHLTLVVDEHGGLQGVVTLEDLFETLLGLEIVDEADTATDMRAFARAQWEKRAGQLGLFKD